MDTDLNDLPSWVVQRMNDKDAENARLRAQVEALDKENKRLEFELKMLERERMKVEQALIDCEDLRGEEYK